MSDSNRDMIRKTLLKGEFAPESQDKEPHTIRPIDACSSQPVMVQKIEVGPDMVTRTTDYVMAKARTDSDIAENPIVYTETTDDLSKLKGLSAPRE